MTNDDTPFHLEDSVWRQRLAPDRYAVLRRHATERPGSSPFLHEQRDGLFHCAGCGAPLFHSRDKFHSGSGWPSFAAVIAGAVATAPDQRLATPRTEVHCRNCGGHLGHVFDDGPPPSGQRYCVNGLALTFAPGNEAA